MKNPFKSLTNILAEGVKQKKLLLYGSYVFSKAGLTMVPYYLTQEAASDNLKITPSFKIGIY